MNSEYKTFRRFWISFGILLLVSQSQCPHCSFLPRSNLLKTNLKTNRNQFKEPAFFRTL